MISHIEDLIHCEAHGYWYPLTVLRDPGSKFLMLHSTFLTNWRLNRGQQEAPLGNSLPEYDPLVRGLTLRRAHPDQT